ncbi:MAG TPA: EamA family transporter [Bryobacteraceae bacterium]
MSAAGRKRAQAVRSYGALASVCLFWGTTYLTIRMALESFPPLALVAIRFSLAGAILLAAAILKGAHLPKGRELWGGALTGVLLLGGSNTFLVVSETWIPSGMAALFITISPFWLVGTEALMPGGDRLHRPTILGMLVGLGGTALLVLRSSPGEGLGSGPLLLRGFLLLQLGNACWALGSIYYRRQPARAHPIVVSAIQMLAAGLVLALATLVIPEHPITPNLRGVAGLVYLIIFGSIVGYSSYIYALSHLRVAVVSVYPYFNTVVAVFLGWWFYREPFGLRETAAMIVIFTGVALVKRASK